VVAERECGAEGQACGAECLCDVQLRDGRMGNWGWE
jgi:hypothetical protein